MHTTNLRLQGHPVCDTRRYGSISQRCELAKDPYPALTHHEKQRSDKHGLSKR